jgi:hypothetical protein
VDRHVIQRTIANTLQQLAVVARRIVWHVWRFLSARRLERQSTIRVSLVVASLLLFERAAHHHRTSTSADTAANSAIDDCIADAQTNLATISRLVNDFIHDAAPDIADSDNRHSVFIVAVIVTNHNIDIDAAAIDAVADNNIINAHNALIIANIVIIITNIIINCLFSITIIITIVNNIIIQSSRGKVFFFSLHFNLFNLSTFSKGHILNIFVFTIDSWHCWWWCICYFIDCR